MKSFCNAFAVLLAALCTAGTASAIPLVWRANWPDAKPVETLVHRGTDIELQPQFYINKEPVSTTNWTFQTFVQTNNQATGEWFGPLPGAFFSHTNDIGAAFYNVMVRAAMPGGQVNYTAFARLRMLDSPGFTPGELPLPVATIDFSKVVALNAPWLLPGATNDIGSIRGELGAISNSVSTLSAATATNAAAIATLTNTTQALSNSISTLNDTKASKADATLTPIYSQTPTFSEWTFEFNDYAPELRVTKLYFDDTPGIWEIEVSEGDIVVAESSVGGYDDATSLTFPLSIAGWSDINAVTATRVRTDIIGYTLGSQSDKPLQPKGDYATIDDIPDVSDFATPADVYRIVAGTNVVLVITNYNSTAHAPSMKLQHLDLETDEYVTYWDEAVGHANTLTNAMHYADDLAAALDAAKAPRAWSRVTSGLGADAPEGTTFISTPVTHISGGFEFEKKITAGGTVWTLCSTSLAAGSTTNGYFEISALDGTPVFSVEKTDSVLVGVNASAIDVVGSACVISVPAVADTHPFARVATTLVQPTWYKEDSDGMPAGSPASVTWSGQSGAWVATVDFGSSPQGFVFFEYLQEGRVKIVNSAVVDLSQGVHYGGATYLPTVSGNELKFIRQQ